MDDTNNQDSRPAGLSSGNFNIEEALTDKGLTPEKRKESWDEMWLRIDRQQNPILRDAIGAINNNL